MQAPRREMSCSRITLCAASRRLINVVCSFLGGLHGNVAVVEHHIIKPALELGILLFHSAFGLTVSEISMSP